jgi:hypothetical protein
MALLVAILILATTVHARIHGYIRDAASGEALIGANVQLLDTRLGSATNLDGYFVIPAGPSGPIRLQASYSGYETRIENAVVLPGQDLLVTLELKAVSILLDDLVVTAERTEQERMQQEVNAGQVRVDAQRLRLSPVLIQSDVLRAFQTLPGVLPSSDFSSELNIRGSGSDESLIVLDGVEVYNPSHLGGLFSSFIPSTVKHADLTRSSYGAHHGGRLGGVLQVSTREGNTQELSTDISLGLLSSSLMLEGPLYGTDKSSWMVAGRRSYLDLATKVLTPDNQVPFYFTDFQGRASLVPGTWDRVSLTGYWGDDVLDAGSVDFGFGNRAGTVNWRHIWSASLYSRAIAAYTRYYSKLNFNGKDGYLEDNFLHDASVRLLLEYHKSEDLYLETGVVLKTITTSYESWGGGDHIWDVDQTMSEVSIYHEASWHPFPRWIIEPGLRLAMYRTKGLLESGADTYTRWEPRLGVKYFITEKLRAKLALGLYNQALQKYKRDGQTFSSVYTVLDSTAAPAHAMHYTGGLELDLADGTWLELEGYYKHMHDVREGRIMGSRQADDPSPIDSLFHFGQGEAWGVDLSVTRNRGLWTGQLGYSLSWSYRDVPGVNDDRPYYAAFDTRHNMNLLANRNFRFAKTRGFPFNRWVKFFSYNAGSLNMGLRYASGPRFTRPYSLTWLGSDGLNRGEGRLGDYGSRNSSTLSAYNRVDLAWTFVNERPGRRFECKVGVLNVFNSPNYSDISFNFSDDIEASAPTVTQSDGIRRLPSIELNWKF